MGPKVTGTFLLLCSPGLWFCQGSDFQSMVSPDQQQQQQQQHLGRNSNSAPQTSPPSTECGPINRYFHHPSSWLSSVLRFDNHCAGILWCHHVLYQYTCLAGHCVSPLWKQESRFIRLYRKPSLGLQPPGLMMLPHWQMLMGKTCPGHRRWDTTNTPVFSRMKVQTRQEREWIRKDQAKAGHMRGFPPRFIRSSGMHCFCEQHPFSYLVFTSRLGAPGWKQMQLRPSRWSEKAGLRREFSITWLKQPNTVFVFPWFFFIYKCILKSCFCCVCILSCSIMSDCLWPHGL